MKSTTMIPISEGVVVGACILCSNPPERPKLLNCSHTFCHRCIQIHYGASDEPKVVCPRNDCQRITPLPSKIISDLPDGSGISYSSLAIIARNISHQNIEDIVPDKPEPVVTARNPEAEVHIETETCPAEKTDEMKAPLTPPTTTKPATLAQQRMRASEGERNDTCRSQMQPVEVEMETRVVTPPVTPPPNEPVQRGFTTRISRRRNENRGRHDVFTMGLGHFFASNLLTTLDRREARELPWGRDPYDGWGTMEWGVHL